MWVWVWVWVVVVVVVYGDEPPIYTAHNTSASDDIYNTTSDDTNTSTDASNTTTPSAPVLCEEAKIKCALRKGCGMALQNYMLGCTDLIAGRTAHCDRYCSHTLVALMSAEEGAALMECECMDDYCRESKARVEVCRVEVEAALQPSATVSCSLAHWICSSDTRCLTAISYYDRLCRRMFAGKGCSQRCNNSISILQRQPKAAQLQQCECDGSEPFPCEDIKTNMARLCFHEVDEEELQREEENTNHVDTSAVSSRAALNPAPSPPTPSSLLYLSLTLTLTFILPWDDFGAGGRHLHVVALI